MANTVKFGLKKVHYAVITEEDGEITYSEPVHIDGAVSLTVTPKGNKADFYAEDRVYFKGSINQGYEGTLEVAIVPDEFKINVLGYKKDKNNVLFEDANAKAKDIALMFEFMSDVKAIRHVFFNVAVEPDTPTPKGMGFLNTQLYYISLKLDYIHYVVFLRFSLLKIRV